MVKAMNDPLTEALRTLPDPMPPEGLWDDIAQRLDRQRIAVRCAWPRAWFRVLPVAVLASAAALGIWLLLAPAPERPVGFLDPAIAELLMESQSLEALVHSRRLAASPTRSALLIRIADVDARLNDAWLAEAGVQVMEPLLQRRVALLHSLVDLGYRPVARYNPALRPVVLTGDDR
jgi:hypothetical protein